MSVLTDIFGAHVECGAWGRERELPLYIATGYAFSTVKINGYKFILISPKEELVTLPALKKQMERIKNVENIPVAIHLSSISLYRRKKLFENGIPFLTQKQAYLPFLGTYLTNESHEEKGLSKFLFSTQQLVLLFLYSDSKKLYVSDATNILPFSAMTMSRAVKQLEITGLFQIYKEGVKKVIESEYEGKELYEKLKGYLNSPVRQTGYIDKGSITEKMVLASESVLAEETMLNSPIVKTYAVFSQNIEKEKVINEIVDPDTQVRIELWEYDPRQFSENDYADKISVALSFLENKDERIEEAVEALLEGVWRK